VSLFDDALALLPEGDEERRRSIRLRRAVAVIAHYHGGRDARVGGIGMTADRSSQEREG
jgi:hypothetical protein